LAVNAGAWSETAFISIQAYAAGASGTDTGYAAITETIDIDMGDKDIDQVPTLIGGRVVKKVPQDITTITFEGYPVDIDSTAGTGVSEAFHGGTWDTSEPLAVTSSRNRDLFRIAILWTDDSAATTAAGATAVATNSYRIVFAHAYMTSMKPSFTDGILKFTFSFKCPAFNKNGIGLIHEDSGDATALAALNTYGSVNYPPTGSTAYTW
jgi:hypothetical protein